MIKAMQSGSALQLKAQAAVRRRKLKLVSSALLMFGSSCREASPTNQSSVRPEPPAFVLACVGTRQTDKNVESDSFTWRVDEARNQIIDLRKNDDICQSLANCRVVVDANQISVGGKQDEMTGEGVHTVTSTTVTMDRGKGTAALKGVLTVTSHSDGREALVTGNYKCERTAPANRRI